MTGTELTQLLGNVGEFVGAIAVVFSLIYLALQVRGNTRAIKGSTHQALNDNHQYELHWANEIAELWVKSNEEQPNLSPVEAFKLNAWLISAMNTRENAYYQYRHGLIEEEKWLEHERIIGNMLSSEWRTRWWETVGVRHYTPAFRAHVEAILDREPAVDFRVVIDELAAWNSLADWRRWCHGHG